MEKSFGEFLKEKRQEKNLTQKELAKELFISESAVSKWEKNVAHPDITILPKLAALLGVSEHELITASVDKEARQDKVQAKRWRNLSKSWNLTFYIAYSIALLTCFICNLAVSGTLSWFWIVFSSLLLAFTFTNLHQYIKKYRLIFIPLSMFLAIIFLLAVCAIYSGGNWFWVATTSITFAFVMIFVPIFISKYKIFSKLNRFNDFISVAIDFIMLNILLIVINIYTSMHGFSTSAWYFEIAFPIVIYVYAVLNLLLAVRFLKINKLLKTSVILTLVNLFSYGVTSFIKIDDVGVQKEIDRFNVFRANFSIWSGEVQLGQNINCIIFLTLVCLTLVFFISGLIVQLKRGKNN